jgi:hypothetical protein
MMHVLSAIISPLLLSIVLMSGMEATAQPRARPEPAVPATGPILADLERENLKREVDWLSGEIGKLRAQTANIQLGSERKQAAEIAKLEAAHPPR